MGRGDFLDSVEFERQRQEVLRRWPTGREVDIDEAVAYHRGLSPERSAVPVVTRALREGHHLISPRGGVAPFRKHKALAQRLVEEGADLAPCSLDSYTRHEKYGDIEAALKVGEAEDKVVLNGYPIVNYGVAMTRQLVESVSVPINIRATTQQPLAAEIALAAGMTYIDNATLHTAIGYRKKTPIEDCIKLSRYIGRLIGEYERRGAPIWAFARTGYTGTMVPPCIQLVTAVFEAVVSAEQGVKNFSIACSQALNVAQDLAVLKVGPKLTREYLDRLGYNDVNLCTELSVYTAAFPADRAQAFGIIGLGAVVAALGNATIVMVKSPEEGLALPSPDANAEAIRATKQVFTFLENQKLMEDPQVVEEAYFLEKEMRAILDRILELGDGDLVAGLPRAFDAGVMDVPFSPSVFNAGRMIPVRDNQGAVRILDPGNLPLDRETVEFHKRRIADREAAAGRKADYDMLIEDVLSTMPQTAAAGG